MPLRQILPGWPTILTHPDLTRVRFGHSPLRELTASLRVLRHRQNTHLYHRWVSAIRGRLSDLDMDLLTALVPAGQREHGFLFPPVIGASPDITDELESIAALPDEVIRRELEATAQDKPVAPSLQALYQHPRQRLSAVRDELLRYWRVALEPFWPQIRAIVRVDQCYRMEQFAAGGVAYLLQELHPDLSLQNGALHVHKARRAVHHCDLAGQPIVLLPCVFAWPTLTVGCCGVEQPSLSYPPRGIAGLGGGPPGDRVESSDRLSPLVGRSKLNVLTALDYPKTTTQLAKELNVSPAAVSQHLKVLSSTNLVVSRRGGRMVWYQRTAAAAALLSSVCQADKPAGHENPAEAPRQADGRAGLEQR
jgi:DNA-binding transcriptional ArsR family regulator